MRFPQLPDTWTAGRSCAALIALASTLDGAPLGDLQLDLMRWELEKYGPCFHEPGADVLIAEGRQRIPGLPNPRAVAIAHGCEILRRRGRGLLESTLAAAARVAVFAPPSPWIDQLLYDVSTFAYADMALDDGHGDVQLGNDEIRDLEIDPRLPRRPTLPELAHQLRLCVQLVDRPPGWTAGHALAFLIHAAHVVERPAAGPVPERAHRFVGSFCMSVSPPDLLRAGEQLFARCEGSRFVVMRVVEDQLMHFIGLPPDIRNGLVQIVNSFAADDLTAWRRAIITATMAVLATSPKAMQRDRQCGEWPRLRA